MLERVSNPVQPAFSLDDAKMHIRVDQSLEDKTLQGFLDAAVDEAARYTRRAINQQTYRQALDFWPGLGAIILPMAPIASVVNVYYRDANGAAVEVDDNYWSFRRTPTGGCVELLSTFTLPALSESVRPGVWCDFIAGYDADDGSSGDDDPELKMPPAIKQAVMLTFGHFYANREAVVSGKVPMILPRGAEYLLDFLRIYR